VGWSADEGPRLTVILYYTHEKTFNCDGELLRLRITVVPKYTTHTHTGEEVVVQGDEVKMHVQRFDGIYRRWREVVGPIAMDKHLAATAPRPRFK